MKKVVAISVVIFVAIFVGLFMTKVQVRDTNVTRSKTRVGLVMNGVRNDHSWGQAHFEGLRKSAEKLNLEIDYRELVSENDSIVMIMDDIIAKGAKMIIANSFGFGPFALKAAAKHPDVKFFHATGVTQAPNLSTYFGRIYQMRYLSGIVAGMQTKTNEIAYVASFEIPEEIRHINAFTLGVHKVNPGAKVFVKWCNTWIDEEKTRNAAQALLDNHNVDLITVGLDALSAYELAEEKGLWIIGYNVDNSELYPKRFLTAPIWNWDAFYTARILEVLQNKFESKHYWEGVESGILGLAPFTKHVVEGAQAAVDAEMARLKSGMFDVFYGPIEDNKGEVRVLAGESMTDEDMLNNFNWYVKGVVVDE